MKKKKKEGGKTVKEKIEKSDGIIVVAKTPIQEILKQIELAKKTKSRLKEISKKAVPKKKKQEIRLKQKIRKEPEEITSDLYQRGQQNIDYSKLFDYLGSGKDAYSQYISNLKYSQEQAHEHSYELGEEKLETLIRQELTNQMLFGRDGVKEIKDIKEKERFDYWKQFNRLWVMIKVDLLGFGYNG